MCQFYVCKTQMIPPPDHHNPVDMHTSIICINILQNIIAGQTMYLYPDGRTYGRTDRDKYSLWLVVSSNPCFSSVKMYVMYRNFYKFFMVNWLHKYGLYNLYAPTTKSRGAY
jgi:hypothetical protein